MAFHLLQSMKSDTDNVQICQKVLNSQDIMRKGCQIIQGDFPLMQVQNYCNIQTSFILHLLSHGIAAHQFRELFMEKKKEDKKTSLHTTQICPFLEKEGISSFYHLLFEGSRIG